MKTAKAQTKSGFAPRLLAWFDQHGRHDLPWQYPRTPYRVWLSEVMLQQTQVAVVSDYFQRFVAALPDLPALADAPQDRVLALWSGLGYYTRARNLHAAAKLCMAHHHGQLPDTLDALLALPGIGRSTAGAILALAHGQRAPILDGNAKRVFCRAFGITGWPGQANVERKLWALAQDLLPAARVADYTQALMDLGATVCTRANPACASCPMGDFCHAHRRGRTASLPAARPGKPLPLRTTQMLIIEDAAGRILLEKRPPVGVWAALWSLPEQPDRSHATAWLRQQFGVELDQSTALTPLQHGFSHYRLQIHPLLITVNGGGSAIADNAGLRWTARAELPGLGLPAPVRKLLQGHRP